MSTVPSDGRGQWTVRDFSRTDGTAPRPSVPSCPWTDGDFAVRPRPQWSRTDGTVDFTGFNHSSPGQFTNLGYCPITRLAVSYLSFKGLCSLIRGVNPLCCASYREACIFDFNRNFIGFLFLESDTTPDTRREFNDLRVLHIPRKSRIILIKRHHVSLSDNRFVYRMRYNLEMHNH
jgi:hypothetical protein